MAKDSEYRRRFMAPLVDPPCQGVSAHALLDHSLILAAEIARSRSATSFVVRRRSCRAAIRLVGLLSVFLEGVRDHHDGARVSDDGTIVAGLSELHVALQRVRRLLHECSRRGGRRVWSLMTSCRIAGQFGTTMSSIAAAADLLVTTGGGEVGELPEEAAEYGRLVAKQAAKCACVGAVDVADDRTAKDVLRILSGFEKGVRPDREIIRSVFSHLGISSRSDCDEEVSFLEEEIGFASSSDETSLLSSLIALVVYSRSVHFVNIDGYVDVGGVRGPSGRGNNYEINSIDPEVLRCPISLETMNDPVIMVCTGQTYERGSIVRWLKSGNRTCPVTGKNLPTVNFVPNLAVKNVIQKFSHHNHNRILSTSEHRLRKAEKASSRLPGSPAAAGAMRMLASLLVSELSSGSHEERSEALRQTRRIARSSGFNRLCLVEAGCVPWVLHFLASWDPLVQENSMAVLVDFVKHPDDRRAVFDSGGLVHIVEVLTQGLSVGAQQYSAVALSYFSTDDRHRREIGESPGAIPALVRMLQTSKTPRGKTISMTALLALLLSKENRRRVLEADAVPHLFDILSSTKEDDDSVLASDSLSVLGALAEGPEGTHAILRLPSSIPALVSTLRSSTTVFTREQCASLLLSLFRNTSGKVSADLRRFPHLMPSLYSLITEGSQRAAKRASSLISLLIGEPPKREGAGSPRTAAATRIARPMTG